MGLIIQGKEISGVVIGNQKFTRPIDRSVVWFDCPDVTELTENSEVSFNTGASTIMKYDESTHTGTFKSDLRLLSTLTVSSSNYSGIKVPVCLIQLPEGFMWGDGQSEELNLYCHSITKGTSSSDGSTKFKLSYRDNRLYVYPYVNAYSVVSDISLTSRTTAADKQIISYTDKVELPGIYQKED